MTQTHIIDGKKIADTLLITLKEELKTYAFQPALATIVVGEDPSSHIYVNRKIKTCEELGIASHPYFLPSSTTEAELTTLIDDLNRNPHIDGILIQIPLPPHLDPVKMLSLISPDKDVDGFHPVNAGKLALGQDSLVPCTALGCIKLLKEISPDLSGLKAVVVGRSNIVGKPTALLLLRENCTVTIAHSRTKDLSSLCRRADILIAAVGKPRFIKAEWIKPGAFILDVGITRHEGKLIGDVDFQGALGIAAAISPVPKGVGPMTIAGLMYNTLKAALKRRGI